jgi:single-stranded-DNA-specific exonuclease
MQKRWNLPDADETIVSALHQALKINSTLCRLLVVRGIHNFEAAKAFFRPAKTDIHDPFLMKDMDKATDRLTLAFTNKEKILVFGDYDVDGTTSVALMYQFLCEIYTPDLLDFYIPHRYREGYGVSKMGIDYAAAEGYSLIIALDCGIKSADLVAYAATFGIDFIICDHHLPDPVLPNAVAILNPKQPDCPYPYKELCGCGVGFKLVTALAILYGIDESRYWCYADLLATAIAADIVPMTGENRVFATIGLAQINTHPCHGIRILAELGGVKGRLSINNVVFVIAPRINAAGRMDDARKAVELFIEKDAEKAAAIATLLNSDNTDRKEADTSITEEALAMLQELPDASDRKSTVVYKESWHKGVVGIVASRLIERVYRPTVVLTKSGEVVAGSARSVPGFNLYEAIHSCRQYLLGYGGHFAAAGLSMLPEHVAAFSECFETVVAKTIAPESLIPEIRIDAEIRFAEISPSLFNIIRQMEPFGPENMRPVFIARQVRDTGHSRVVKDQHLRFVVQQDGITFTGIGFNLADRFSLLQAGHQPVDLVFTIDENEWNGTTTLQLKVIDLRQSLSNTVTT